MKREKVKQVAGEIEVAFKAKIDAGQQRVMSSLGFTLKSVVRCNGNPVAIWAHPTVTARLHAGFPLTLKEAVGVIVSQVKDKASDDTIERLVANSGTAKGHALSAFLRTYNQLSDA